MTIFASQSLNVSGMTTGEIFSSDFQSEFLPSPTSPIGIGFAVFSGCILACWIARCAYHYGQYKIAKKWQKHTDDPEKQALKEERQSSNHYGATHDDEQLKHFNAPFMLDVGSMNEVKQVLLAQSKLILSDSLEYKEEIGKGAFGIVYKGILKEKESEQQVVAAKVIYRSYLTSDTFEKEINILLKLDHKNIVKLIGAALDPYNYVLVLEYVARGSLRKLLEQRIPLAWQQKEEIALDIVRGLAYLHQQCVLHRDLKDANVLLDENYRAKLCDFGLSKITRGADSTQGPSNYVGTPRWSAPEVLAGAKHTEKSDICSNGIVLWQLASEKVIPFAQVSNHEIQIYLQSSEEPEIIPNECKQNSPRLARAITFSWFTKQEKRRSIGEIIEALENNTNCNDNIYSFDHEPVDNTSYNI